MFETIRGYFGQQQRANPENSAVASVEDLRLAAGVVFLAAAKADGLYTADEADLIYETVETKFGLSREKTESFLSGASTALEQSSTDHFVGIINKQFTPEEREKILSVVWAVILADGKCSAEESRFAANLRASLELSMEQGIRARKTAEGVGFDGFMELLKDSPEVQQSVKDRSEGL